MLKKTINRILQKRFCKCVLLGFLVCSAVTVIIMPGYVNKYPEYTLSYQELLNCADFQNYSVQENGLISTTIDPIIVIPLPEDKNDIKAISIEIAETSGYNDYWAQLFLYDDNEWVNKELWISTGTTYCYLNGSIRTEDFDYLRIDLCDVEQVFISLEKVTVNPRAVFLKAAFTAGLFYGLCACLLLTAYLEVREKRKKRAGFEAESALGTTSTEDVVNRGLIQKGSLGRVDYLLCVILSLGFTAAPYYIRSGTCKIDLPFILTAILLFAVFCGSAAVIRSQIVKKRVCILPGSSVLRNLLNRKYGSLWVGLIIFSCWFPLLVMLYPGTVINDTWGELQQFLNYAYDNQYLTDHNPFFDTLFMGSMIVPAALATGKWHIFLFVYTLIQALATCFSFAYAVHYAYKKLEISINAVYIMLVAYCLLPIFPLSAQTIGKDSIAAWLFVLYSVQIIEVVRTKGSSLKNGKFLFILIVLGITLGLTRKVNFYIVLASLFLIVVFERGYRKKTVAALLCTILLIIFILPAIKVTLNVYPGGNQEMFSLPFQMSARYVRDYPEDISDEEYDVLDKVLTMDDLSERYDPVFSDPVKGYQQKGSDADYLRYIKVWAAQGIRHPDAYIHAVNSMLAGWFSWERYIPLMDMNWHSQLNTAMIPDWVPYRGVSLTTATAMQSFYNGLYFIPFISILFTYGLYASVIPAFIAGTVCRRRKGSDVRYWIGVVPTALSLVLGCWLAPASINIEGLRYLYPVTYTLPLLLMWCLYVYQQQNHE